jgi:site-specific DNA recombinase
MSKWTSPRKSASDTTTPKRRCAVYTRKSTEEGLEQEYNSLEAQRDAGLSFIASQRHEGWIVVDDGYDDGGFTGGNMERPALKRLLADIEAKRIDVVVVYKIDRLSRSLGDFARMMDHFDQNGVTFVSVTQQFNTTTSMGRLTLNILLSFAQFEREVTGERIRDKFAASKAKGMWMGGVPPLGYDIKDRKLVINESEADLVRDIFTRYAEHGSATRLVRELQIEGRTTKSWVTQEGRVHCGRVIDRPCLYNLLRNRLYLGEMTHKGHSYPGQHDALVSKALWDAVETIIEARKRGPRTRYIESPALLAGLLYAQDGQRMLATHTSKKNGKRYRYYVPCLDKRRAAGTVLNDQEATVGALPAVEIEAAVLAEVHGVLQQPEVVIGVWKAAEAMPGGNELDEPQTVVALRQIGEVWDQLFPTEQHRIMRLLIERVTLRDDGLDIFWSGNGWRDFGVGSTDHLFVTEQRQGVEC